MGIGERLRKRRMEMKLTRNQLAEMVHVTPSAIANYENGVSYPKPEIFISLIVALNMDANYLYQDYLPDNYMDRTCRISLSEEEKDSIDKYRDLTESGKNFIRMIINEEYARIQAENWITIPLRKAGARRPNSGFLMNEEKQVLRLPAKICRTGQNSAFRYRLTEYEPVFKKGDVIALLSSSARHNEMGIFSLNGIYYIRTLIREQNSCRLRALNVMDPEIVVKEEDEFYCVGKIIGKVHGNFEIKDGRYL